MTWTKTFPFELFSLHEMNSFRCNDSTLQRITWRSPIDQTREKLGNPSDLDLLQKTFDRMK